MNIIEYTENQSERFENKEFGAVDSLVLSQFTYLYFNDVVPEYNQPVRIAELLKAEYFGRMFNNVNFVKNAKSLLFALGMSPRFRDIQMCFYVDKFDAAEQKQFAAVTYLLDDDTAYIAYRGTDATFIGWKEDFNMAFILPVPAQRESVVYLNEVAENIPHKLLVGGHSKGGNLAVYSASECNPAVRERIAGIYSHDGPGFRDEFFTSYNYELIKPKIHKTLPQSSLVGMLLQQQEDYSVVESNQFWVMQHDAFSWEIESDDFRYLENITESAEHINKTVNQWLSELDDEKRELFVTSLYKVAEATGIVKFNELSEGWQKRAVLAMKAVKGIDPETKRFVSGTIKSLAALSLANLNHPLKRHSNAAPVLIEK